MAKMSLKQREEKREKLVAKYAKKYAELQETARNANSATRSATPPVWSCKSCRATPIRRGCAIGAS